jgi:5'(3')-deoxyribonucleotidase
MSKVFVDLDDTVIRLAPFLLQTMMERKGVVLDNWEELCRTREVYRFQNLSEEHPLGFMRGNEVFDLLKEEDFYTKYPLMLQPSEIVSLIWSKNYSELVFTSVTLPQHLKSKQEWLGKNFPGIDYNFIAFESDADKIDHLKRTKYDLYCDDQLSLLQAGGVPAEACMTFNREYIKPIGKETLLKIQY